MKKTYNVISRKNALSSVTVVFFFALFFLGMSSSATAQLATSRANAGIATEVDHSITLKAEVNKADEVVLQIFKAELNKVREEAISDLLPTEETEVTARLAFLTTAVSAMEEKSATVHNALFMAQNAMAMHINGYKQTYQDLLDQDGIVREYVSKLK
jgi:hypothetical protein